MAGSPMMRSSIGHAEKPEFPSKSGKEPLRVLNKDRSMISLTGTFQNLVIVLIEGYFRSI